MDSYIDTADALAEVVRAFRRASVVAVDTEAASFHRYVDRIYLVQLSTGADTAIVDPVAVSALGPLGELLAEPTVEKVFHDADYDLRILDRDYGFRARRLFDTRIAAQLAGESAIGLASLVQKYCGVRLSKAHQKADWSRRPLPREMLAYAVEDTRHLPQLREALRARVAALGRLAWAEEECARLEALRWTGPGDGEEAWRRVKGVKSLEPRQLAAFRELHRWRDDVARREDKAPFRVIGNDALLAVARARAATPEQLERIPPVALPRVLARRHGEGLVAAVRRALALADSELPRLERGPRGRREPGLDERIERLKAARNRVAGALALEPGVLCGRPVLEAVARAGPKDRAGLAQVGELRRWQIEVLGDALLEALR